VAYQTIFAALSDPTRRQVLQHVASGPKAVVDIAVLMPISRPAVSQHLAQLKLAKLVIEERNGTRRVYRVDRTGVDELRSWVDMLWSEALNNLKTLSESEHAKRSKQRRR
jgi:DNA-binding transcriptional ArsR family regulator